MPGERQRLHPGLSRLQLSARLGWSRRRLGRQGSELFFDLLRYHSAVFLEVLVVRKRHHKLFKVGRIAAGDPGQLAPETPARIALEALAPDYSGEGFDVAHFR